MFHAFMEIHNSLRLSRYDQFEPYFLTLPWPKNPDHPEQGPAEVAVGPTQGSITALYEEIERWEAHQPDSSRYLVNDDETLANTILRTYGDYIEEFPDDHEIPVGAEARLGLDTGEHRMEGQVDLLLYTSDGQLTIRDYTTTASTLINSTIWPKLAQLQRYALMYNLSVAPGEGVTKVQVHQVSFRKQGSPKFNKDGALSKRAFAMTEQAYRNWCADNNQAVDEGIAYDLATNPRFFTSISSDVYLGGAAGLITDGVAFFDAAKDIPAHNVSGFCQTCQYAPLCRAELGMGNYDTVRELNFRTKEDWER